MQQETLTNIIIREATLTDIDRINLFITPFIEEKKLLPRTYDELEDLIKNLFIAEMGDRVMGCAALEIYSKKLAEVRSLAVAHELQGLGVGKKLVAACIERAKAHNILEVMAVTSSEDFFKACGFDFTLPGEKKALFYQTKDT